MDSPALVSLSGESSPAAPALPGPHHPELDQPLDVSLPGGRLARYRALSALQFARRNPALCLWVASSLGGRAGRLCAEAMAVRAGLWPGSYTVGVHQ